MSFGRAAGATRLGVPDEGYWVRGTGGLGLVVVGVGQPVGA